MALPTPYFPPLPISTGISSPDFNLCHPTYGTGLVPSDCNEAASFLVAGEIQQQYYVNDASSIFHIPFGIARGTCQIWVEVAGPSSDVTFVWLTPDTLRNMASWIISQCVVGRNGLGGFATNSLQQMIDYVTDLSVDLGGPYPASSAFVTLSVTGPWTRPPESGDTDPAIPLLLAAKNLELRAMFTPSDAMGIWHFNRWYMFDATSLSMTRGGLRHWSTQAPLARDEVTYECDSDLGNPIADDCLILQYQHPGSESDTITVPSNTESKLLSYQSCHLAISASVAITLTWAQVQAALDTLMNMCIQHPLQASVGGKAYYGPESQLDGRQASVTVAQSNLTGLNALPPYANITLFTVDASASEDCTWQAIVDNLPVTTCDTA
ncbi:hypothetical protein MMC06_006708 [Schaereria dolodes]|nr:hypothetical protein [Schaereria dolodes]